MINDKKKLRRDQSGMANPTSEKPAPRFPILSPLCSRARDDGWGRLEPFSRALKEGSVGERLSALKTLRGSGDIRTVMLLSRACLDPERRVSEEAVDALRSQAEKDPEGAARVFDMFLKGIDPDEVDKIDGMLRSISPLFAQAIDRAIERYFRDSFYGI